MWGWAIDIINPYLILQLVQVRTVWGVDPQVDWQVANALVAASHPVSLVLDLLHDGVEVHELLTLAVQKLAILWKIMHKYNFFMSKIILTAFDISTIKLFSRNFFCDSLMVHGPRESSKERLHFGFAFRFSNSSWYA